MPGMKILKSKKNAYKQYKALKKELKEDGVEIELDSVYRSVKTQQDLWDEWSADPEKGIDIIKGNKQNKQLEKQISKQKKR